MENKRNKSLLERYGIPIHHLDFKYIRECKDAKEIEKIVHILRSNEEGYFPDLTTCAEEKLKELKPHSRLFRFEEPIKGREALQSHEIKPIYDWNQDIKTTDKKLQKLVKEDKMEHFDNSQLPPVRQGGRIQQNQSNKGGKIENTAKTCLGDKTSQRIKSTDYDKWDKYDAEEEILRVDLAEERQQEEVERRNRLNAQKFSKEPLKITEITEDDEVTKDKWSNLSEIEREKISEEFRLRGNEYFRSKEYENALNEYTRAIQACPGKAVAAYNNRALTYFKQQNFFESLKDCEESLRLEPNNLKARLRLADASYAYGRRRESYQLYISVLQLDSTNSVALKAITELRKEFEDLPPPNATRIKIQDECATSANESAAKRTEKPKPKSFNYDLADLVKPNRVVKNRLIKAAENLGNSMKINKDENQQKAKKITQESQHNEIRLPFCCSEKSAKKLIEEL